MIGLSPVNGSDMIQRVAETSLPTELGWFHLVGYESPDGEEFVALVKGELQADSACIVRIHSQCLTGDVFHSFRCDCGNQLTGTIDLIEREGVGVIVYQLQEGRGIGLVNKIRAYALQDQGHDTIEANLRLGFEADNRRYERCAAILLDLGLRKIRFVSNNPEKIRAMKDAGLEITERVNITIAPHPANREYLRTKRDRMGHLIDPAI